MLHETIFLATCNATMTNKKTFKLQRGCYTQATCLATLRKVEGRSTFLATRNAKIAVAKWGVTGECFLATISARMCTTSEIFDSERKARFLLNEHDNLYFLLHNNSAHVILFNLKKNY